MPDFSSRGIFLSYRRADAAPYARLLQLQLKERLPAVRVFMDLDSIEPGLDFAEVIREAVESCALLVVLIGRQWVTVVDEEGHRRLDDPDDYVRFEVQTALDRGVRVVPVLVDGAKPLQRQQLPAAVARLARLNALELSYERYEYDADRLIQLIKRVLDAAAGSGSAAQKSVSKDGAAAPPVLPAKGLTATGTGRELAQERPKTSRDALFNAESLAAAEPSEFARIVKSTPDSTIADVMAGPERTRILAGVFDRIPTLFRTDRAGGVQAVIQWNITGGAGGDTYQTVVEDGACTVTNRPVREPKLAMTMDPVTLLKVVSGDGNPMMMFMTGKIKAKGDLGLAAQVSKLFDLSKA